MEHQNWERKVFASKAGLDGKGLANKVLTEDVQTLSKPKTKGTDGRKLHQILESESLHVQQSSHEFKIAMLQARNAKGIKQKDLAREIGVKESVLSSWESGKAVPDGGAISKLEKVLGTKLPRPPKLTL